MKAFLMILLSVLSWGALNHAQAVMVFESNLSADQEVPPVMSLASGSAELTLNDAQTELAILISIVGLDLDGNQTPSADDDVVAAHIHRAPAGTNGDVVFGFIGPNNDLNNDLIIDAAAGTIFSIWDLGEGNNTTLADELPNLLNEGLYINLHTPAFPGGELRGQILPVVAISEPAIFALFGVGLIGLGLSATAALRRV